MKRLEGTYTGANGRESTFDVTWNPAFQNAPLLLFIHGFKGYKDWGPFNLMAKQFAASGFVVAKINLSHNGTTPTERIDFPDLEAFGRNTFSKEVQDVHELTNVLLTEGEWLNSMDKSKCFLLGHSRGGAIAFAVASKNDIFSKVATWASVADLEKRFTPQQLAYWRKEGVLYIPNARTGQQMPLYLDLLDDYEANRDVLNIAANVKKLKDAGKPQLIIHGTNDETVPIEEAKDLKSRNPDAELTFIENANHTFGGMQPWKDAGLPRDMQQAVELTVNFFKA
jgi:dipeptidyl aminopeptidase/acylaminoacyl peptidase